MSWRRARPRLGFATGLDAAKAAGYRIITPMMPNMGYHYMNPTVTGFNVRRPPILVYEHTPAGWRLGALEWVFTSKPARPPFPGARYGTFPAACHYVDGTFVPAGSQADCGSRSPKTGARFLFWHPLLVTLHVWVVVPEPIRDLQLDQSACSAVQSQLTVEPAALGSDVGARRSERRSRLSA